MGEKEEESGDEHRGCVAAADNQIHSWLPWASAQPVSGPQPQRPAPRLVVLLISLYTSSCSTGARGKSLRRGRCAFLFKQMLLFWTPDFAINFGLFFAICLSQSGFSSPGKLSPCDFINPVLPLLSAAGSPLGLQLEFCSPPLAWLEQLLAYLSPQSHY